MIEFKTEQEKSDFYNEKLDNRIKFIMYALSGYCEQELKKEVTITSIYRPQTNDSGIHSQWRGIDVRSMYFTEVEIKDILEFLNQCEYGISSTGNTLMTAIYHDVGQGKHIHIQVSNNNLTPITRSLTKDVA